MTCAQSRRCVAGSATTRASSLDSTTTYMSDAKVVYRRRRFTAHATSATSLVNMPYLSSVLLIWRDTKATGAPFWRHATNPVPSCTDGYNTNLPYGSAGTKRIRAYMHDNKSLSADVHASVHFTSPRCARRASIGFTRSLKWGICGEAYMSLPTKPCSSRKLVGISTL